MAHKKGMGSSRNGRDSNSQRLGVKAFGGQSVTAGSILVRQRGTLYQPGTNVGLGKDDTLFAKVHGIVTFEPSRRAKSSGKQISVHPVAVAASSAVTIELQPANDQLFTGATEADATADAQ